MKQKHLLLKVDGLNFTRNKISDGILSRWDKTIAAEKKDNIASIDIFDVIGSDFFGEGFTAKRMSAALRSIGEDKDVVVNINSPGGDMFESATIYNLLAQHKGNVTVNILGLAASGASIIAMAGDKIKISKIGFLMIHNAWAIVMGNKNDLRTAADTLEQFDKSLLSVYSSRTNIDDKKIAKMMDNETWIGADDAIEQGFADETIEAKTAPKKEAEKQTKAQAKRTIEMALAHEGFSRKEREEIFQKAGVCDTTDSVLRDADKEDWEGLIEVMKN
ncbi:MAG: head maturation protease, ClpP-related [Candidatus Omnitrophota bacterium]